MKVLLLTSLTIHNSCSMQVEVPIYLNNNVTYLPFITNYFSNDTSSSYISFNLSNELDKFLDKKYDFDVLKIGYLCTLADISLALKLKVEYYNKICFYDPICADNFKLYKNMDQSLLSYFKKLLAYSIITPNFTEAIILSDYEIKDSYSFNDLNIIINKLKTYNPLAIIITGCIIDSKYYNVLYTDTLYLLKYRPINYNFIGAGDRFNAYLISYYLKTNNLYKSFIKASKKTYKELNIMYKKRKS